VLAQKTDEFEFFILVVDNDAELKEGAAIAAEMGVPSVVESERGISAARNRILDYAHRESSSDFIAMIDDDETASPTWLISLMAMQRKTGAHVVSGPTEPVYATEPDIGILSSKAFDTQDLPDGYTQMTQQTRNALVSTKLLFELDWPAFDPAFGLTGGEDREWFTRLWMGGAIFAWSRDAMTYEGIPENRMRVGWILRRTFCYGIDDIRIITKHHNVATRIRYLVEATAVVLTIPLTSVDLIFQPTRLRMMRKWARGFGRIGGALGFRYEHYMRP
jgi:glycosyltransferase involved in cell wall biosynthesis